MSHSTVLSAGIVEGLLHRAVLPPHPRCLACVAGSEPTIKAGFIVPQLPESSADSPSLDADGTDDIVSVIRCVPLFGQNMIGMRARLLPLLCAAIACVLTYLPPVYTRRRDLAVALIWHSQS